MTKEITFGTSGHRGIMGQSFLLSHVVAIGHAVATLLLKKYTKPTLVIGYDPRQGNDPYLRKDSFTAALADTLISRGVTVYFLSTFTPTPVVSWVIVDQKFSGGLILTASHNPPDYNGIKYNPENGAPAPPELTQEIERLANIYLKAPPAIGDGIKGEFFQVNAIPEFAENLVKNLNTQLGTISLPSDLPLAIDTKFGATATTWQALGKRLGLQNIKIIHEQPNPKFGGIEPNPTKYESLTLLKALQKRIKAPIAISNDPDGDRFSVLDEHGQPMTPEIISVIILDYFLSKKLPLWGIATTVASSRICEISAKANDLNCALTKVGFKYFAAEFDKARALGQIALGVESSGGFSTSFHTHEKCGFLPVILLLMIMTATQKTLSTLQKEVEKKYGATTFLEAEYQYPEHKKSAIIDFLKGCEKIDLNFSHAVERIDKTDGLKLIFKNKDWILIRLSGTEPLARIYGESDNKDLIDGLIQETKVILDQIG